MENSERDGNTRPPELLLEKPMWVPATLLELLVQLALPAAESYLCSPTSLTSCSLLRGFLALTFWLLMLYPPDPLTHLLALTLKKHPHPLRKALTKW